MDSTSRKKVKIPGKMTIHAVHTQYHQTCHGLSVFCEFRGHRWIDLPLVYIFPFLIYLTILLVTGCRTWSFALR